MDNLSHTLFGITLANLGWRGKYGRVATWTLAIGANLPDIDAVVRFWGTEKYFAYHRTLTHSVCGLIVLPMLLALFLRLFHRAVSIRKLYVMGLAGVLSHIVMDLLTGWGTKLFSPFADTRFALSWFFIIDPFVLGGLTLSVFAALLLPKFRREFARATVYALGGYLAFCGWNWTIARKAVEAAAVEHGYKPRRILVYAQPFSPLHWMGIAQEEQTIHVLMIGTNGARVKRETITSYPTNLDLKEVKAVLKTDAGRQFVSWSELPVASVQTSDGTHRVMIRDLRFQMRPRRTNRPNRFALHVELDKELKPIRVFWPWGQIPPPGNEKTVSSAVQHPFPPSSRAATSRELAEESREPYQADRGPSTQ